MTRTPDARFLTRLFSRGIRLAWLTLALALAFTLANWRYAANSDEREANLRFESAALDVRDAIRERMAAYGQTLHGGAALFAASTSVERDEWKNYVEHLHQHERFPGIQGMGYAQVVLPHERDAHTRAVRAQGFPDYAIRPEGERAEYTSIIYIEPFSGANLRAFGYDMFSESVRRAAMERARDSGAVALSGKVVLVQETGLDVQSGCLLYHPIYRNGAPQATPAQRRSALLGYVYAPFRMKDLMKGILGAATPQLDLGIYDGAAVTPDALMYDSRHASAPARLVRDIALEVSGRTWTLRLSSTPEFEARSGTAYPRLMLLGGLAISVLLFLIVASLATLRESQARASNILQSALDAIVIIDSNGRIVEFNPSAVRMFGYSRSQALGEELAQLVIPAALREAHRQGLARYIETGTPQALGRLLELRALRADASEFPVELTVVPVRGSGTPLFAGFVRDITERNSLQQQQLRGAERLKRSLIETIGAMAMTVEKRDPYTAGHQRRVAELCLAIGRKLDLPEDRLEGLRLGATIHDIGKIYVPAEILNRPGKLAAPEFTIIKSHPQIGYDIIKDVQFPWPVADMILQHHERLDGSGYPQGLKAEQIILEARIIAVADVVEAISSDRPYRPGLGIEAALTEIERGHGTTYDPVVADACLKLFRDKAYAIPA